MTTPARKTFLDADNPLLAGGPAQLDAGAISLAAGAGNAGVLTLRTTSATVTVIMTAADLDAWAKVISDLAAQVRAAPVLDRAPVSDISALMSGGGRPGMA